MNILLKNLNSFNYIAFALLVVLVLAFSQKHLKHFFYDFFSEKKIKGVRFKNNPLSIREFISLRDKISVLDSQTNQINQSFILKDKLVDIRNQIKQVKRQYLEIYLILQRFKKEKLPENVKINKKDIEQLENQLKQIKKIIDTLFLDQKLKIEDEHSHSLHFLSIIRMTFIPLAVIVTYFKMKFTSMGFDFGGKTNGVWTVKYGQTLVWTLMLISTILIVAGFHFDILA